MMQKYLTFAPYVLAFVWLLIVFEFFKSLKNLKNISGKSWFSLLNPLSFFALKNQMNSNNNLGIAYKKHKETSRKLILVWILSVCAFMGITFLVGIISSFFASP